MLHRYSFLLIALLLAVTPAFAQPTPRVVVKPPLIHVIAYLNGTALEHRAPVALAAGLNRVLVSGLSPRVDAENMEVQLGEGVELLSIEENDEQLPPAKPLNPTAVDSLARAETERRTLEGELEGLKQEKTFLLANQTLP
jgi:hypothetical protein